MPVNDSDLELIHAYLDGELPTAECEGLWRRLASERELKTELDQLRADSSLRSMAWNSLEPDDRTMVRLEANIMRATRREDIMGWAFNGLRIVASAAALILFGFTVGWLGRDRMYATPISGMASGGSQQVVPASAGTMNMTSPQYNVEMLDGNGKIVKIFTAHSEAEAMQFLQELKSHSAMQNSGDASGGSGPDKF
jgi:anti-sigma factor RsiW